MDNDCNTRKETDKLEKVNIIYKKNHRKNREKKIKKKLKER